MSDWDESMKRTERDFAWGKPGMLRDVLSGEELCGPLSGADVCACRRQL